MRACHSSLKADFSRFNILSKAEDECDDWKQMEEHIFCDRKLYEDLRAAMMDVLSKNSKIQSQIQSS
jgi:hypothetical protein